ncbi:hypothetical protein ACFQME_08355, partial [Luteimonas weifangensis]
MSPHEPTPLSPEERALAQRLAQLGPHGEPSPALDTRILAAAHAAAHRAPHRPPWRGWPLGLGIAASLALVLGVAWRLRPLPDVAPAYRSEAESALRSAPAAVPTLPDRAAAAAPSVAAPSTATPPAAVPATATTAAVDTAPPATRSAAPRRMALPTPAPAPTAPQEPPVAFPAPAPMPQPAPPPPPAT